jgi:uncharacterized phiE125 gp8 family phage protein
VPFIQPPFWSRDLNAYGGRWPQHVSVSLVTPAAAEPLTLAEAKSQVRLDPSAAEPGPATPLTVALAGLGAGVCDNGAHRVACSFVTAAGETPPGPLSAPITIVDKTVNGQIAVSGIPAGSPAVLTVKLWMTAIAGALGPLLYAGVVNNGVTTATINLADGSLGASAPAVNTALDTSELAKWISAARMDTEVYTSCCWMQQGVDVRFSHFPFDRSPLVLPIRPLVPGATVSIDYIDASGAPQTLDPATYVVDASAPIGGVPEPGRIMLAFGTFYWPFPPAMRVINGVTVHCTVGYGASAATVLQQQAAVPATAKTAMQLLLANWWLNREAGQIIRGSADILPYGVDRVLDPYRLEAVA